MRRIQATILGATGVVGQRIVRRLARHPQFELLYLAASGRSVGSRYSDACDWRLEGEPWAGLGDRVVRASSPEEAFSPVVFSALEAAAAREIEPAFARAGALVFSNASAFRLDEDVPLLVPELNPSHLGLLAEQRRRRRWSGGIVCNPNCTTTVLLGALGPLHLAFGAEAVVAVSMQALSGAGYPGPASLDTAANVVPFVAGEEEKLETEARKILGSFEGGRIEPARFSVSAHCNRVPVVDGHIVEMSLRLSGSPTIDAIADALESFAPRSSGLGLHSAPERFVSIRQEADRPQPRRDVDADGGMRLQNGRLRPCPVMGAKLVALGNNVERGAAGGTVLNAELAIAGGFA
jgi:aspartate-semialdehyde dehydrogenase